MAGVRAGEGVITSDGLSGWIPTGTLSTCPVGRHFVEPTFEQREATAGSIFRNQGYEKLALLAPPGAVDSARRSLAPPGFGGVMQDHHPDTWLKVWVERATGPSPKPGRNSAAGCLRERPGWPCHPDQRSTSNVELRPEAERRRRWGDTLWSPLSSEARRPQGASSENQGHEKLASLSPPVAMASARQSLAPPGFGTVEKRRGPSRALWCLAG